ncbi:fibronectin type III domain-containing protein [Panacibacter sp. DH6]|uniref:Fibronectin type III domain-containing protein n=1 Tax=Panacibacter microcysteis TaxID=2793269 RepID=A0A931EB61_9BACT|nr:zinc-dependent metalloprotease family protein [Panacibacter microcysteis]MBG9377799.1 fibronectin type III domain-containing protein [Panacibacter microcysteis]
MKRFLLSCISFVSCTMVMAQKSYWSSHAGSAKIQTTKEVARQSFPTTFKLFDLNISPLKSDLFSVAGNASGHRVVITLPNAKGELENFEMVEASNFDKKLQANFPEIRAFSGRSLSDKGATVKLSISPQGIQTMVFRTATENEFIEAYSQDRKTYAVFKSQRTPGKLPWTCSTEDVKLTENIGNQVGGSGVTARSGANLKTLRLAQSVTAEYSNYFGATSSAQVGLVLAAINNTLTRCNGVYEKDLALHLNLIANTTSVIYYNASTDPYSAASTGAGGAWNNELQNTLTAVIGEANYDIGHLFGATGGGGNAGCIGCVCTNGSKGKGFTSPNDGIPTGDNFDIDYVVHEVGHQLGGNHTFSHSNEGTGVNKEVGSGITIMGYAGITTQDVAPHSIDIYHQASIAQIQANINTKTCPVTSTIVNSTPVVNPVSNYTIPISTPFALTGSATDADAGDILTYCWEQNDNASTAQTGNSSRASATKATGPNWITYPASTSPVRYFPNLNTILAGGTTTGPIAGGDAGVLIEALSSVSRTLNFRLTVRDNAPYSSTAPVSVGQTQFTDMVVTVSNTSGPFTVTAPNTAVSWAGNSSQTITWNVANTTATPVSCANVKISLSTDGGLTFPTVLIASTPNDGSQAVTIPNTPTGTARIKIEAVGNIFFDISNANFTITAGAACGTATGLAASAITTSGATVSWSAVSGATSYAVDYKAASSSTWINLSTAQTTTTADITGLAEGTLYDWRVTATCTSGTGAPAAAQFTTTSTAICNAPTGLTSSAITSSGATVSWSAVSGAVSYAVDYKLNSSATWTSFSTAQTATSASLTGLSASSLYDWRVTTNCASGSSTASAAQFTTTAATSTCPGIYDVSTNGTTSGAPTIPFNTDIKGLISPSGDNDYYKFVITNAGTITLTLTTLPRDYDLRLRNSAGTQVAISQNGSTTSETINYTAAAGTYYAQVYGFNNANNANNCYTLKVALGTASKGDIIAQSAINKPLLSVFPNPASSKVNVSLTGYKGTSDIKLFDVNGKQVAAYRTAEVNSFVDISRLNRGVYMLRVVTADGTILTHKVIKQ